MNRTQVILTFVVAFVVLAALFMIPPRSVRRDDEAAITRAIQAISPAADSKEAAEKAPAKPSAQPERPMVYTTEAECAAATGMTCREIRCENMMEGLGISEVCGTDFREGWQAMMPSDMETPQVVPPPPADMKTGPENAPSP
ncbi:MAG: hypothetical protein HYU57_02880 [Micavibrio aeruginosavorus]|nr:hypothetical protein [Micavibrio aeruginosavorus]